MINGAAAPSVLVVDDEDRIRKVVSIGLQKAGFDVTVACDGGEALERLKEAAPGVVISDVMMPGMDGLELVRRMRADPRLREIPVILLTARGSTDDIVTGFGHGADDYIPKPFSMEELLARVQTKLDRPPIPADLMPRDRATGLLNQRHFQAELDRELDRARRGRGTGILGQISIHELDAVRERLGSRGVTQLWRELSDTVGAMAGPIDVVGKAADGSLAIVIPEAAVAEARHQLWEVGQAITARTFVIEGESLHVTPMIGFAPFDDISGTTLSQRVATALSHAATHLDLEPFRWVSGLEPVAALGAKPSSWVWQDLLGLPAQLGLSVLLALVVPFFVYVAAYNSGHDIVPAMYFLVLAGLLVTATLIWIECFMAMKRSDPPEFNGNYPAAVGIIAAYLPNEAATIVETISAFLASDYPGPYEVILAYNTSRSLPVESTLRRMARKDPRFRPIRVRGSTSKAQNVNYAVGQTRAEMIGVFDADHHPEPGSFARAWRWLAAGNDVVQGHCLIRNGSESWVSRTAAVEFELMYAVSHPGRARLHGFGLFGGSNGFWRAHLLRQTRMHGFMLTEDIDSSMRVIETGGKIVSDPFLISRELAPTTLQALWNQRLRWAQGWFEVSIRHTWKALVSTHLTRRQKLGVLHLMSWRELYPWLSVQMYPIIAFWAWRLGGPQRIHWLVPIFVLTTVFTVGTGPTQALVAYLLAHPDVRAHRGWFWWYMGVSVVFYTSFRNLIAVVGQAKHMRGDRQWKVTPRSPGVGST